MDDNTGQVTEQGYKFPEQGTQQRLSISWTDNKAGTSVSWRDNKV